MNNDDSMLEIMDNEDDDEDGLGFVEEDEEEDESGAGVGGGRAGDMSGQPLVRPGRKRRRRWEGEPKVKERSLIEVCSWSIFDKLRFICRPRSQIGRVKGRKRRGDMDDHD